VEELIRAASDYESRAQEEASIAGFLDHLDFIAQSDPQGGPETVNLATVHSAKGLEFPVVFLVGLVEGEFPVDTVKPLEMEEERRLFLVGVTRARSRLYLCYHKKDDGGRATEPSRFIRQALAP
jgi:DNA helicase-2/ATP-dependent DNA helicase PcrA